jgi:hypothetical protein
MVLLEIQFPARQNGRVRGDQEGKAYLKGASNE